MKALRPPKKPTHRHRTYWCDVFYGNDHLSYSSKGDSGAYVEVRYDNKSNELVYLMHHNEEGTEYSYCEMDQFRECLDAATMDSMEILARYIVDVPDKVGDNSTPNKLILNPAICWKGIQVTNLESI